MALRLPIAALAAACVLPCFSLTGFGQEPSPTPPSPSPAASASAPTPDEPTVVAGPTAPVSPRVEQAQKSKLTDADIATAPIKEAKETTPHSVTIHGRRIDYTATAGTITIRDDQGKPTASMFYVAYVARRAVSSPPRPLTFLFNGGPGSASLWLHMGSLGPMRVVTQSPEATAGAPFSLVPNDESILDRTDLVFLDAIGTGYSRALGDTKEDAFCGVDQDIDAFARAIIRYVTVNRRWNSPKFLFGESYGTPRAAGLVFALQNKGMQFNGVSLLSSVLNFGIRNEAFDRLYVSLIPSFAAAAWYHNKISPKPADLAAFLQEARTYASTTYLLALDKGQDLSPLEEQAVAQKLSTYTGLSVEFLKENHLRVSMDRFRKELLRREHRIIGRYDARFLGIDADDGGEGTDFDPSSEYITGAFVGALRDYLTGELHYHTDLDYRPTAGLMLLRKWDWHHRAPGAPELTLSPMANLGLDLGAAMRTNPRLHVLSLNGWYDFATPFFQTEHDLSHLYLDPSLRGNLAFKYYPSGHMVYLNPDALKTMRADVEDFYDHAAQRTGAEAPSDR